MKKNCLALGLILCIACAAKAQQDSNYIDLGRIKLKKEFTQAIAVKDYDLARLPFMSLSEAIRIWANGAYTSKEEVTYIVDGVSVIDADIYSIQDIEEITIVRNSLINQNSAGNMQLLAVITTKQAKTFKPGIVFSAQAHVLKKRVLIQSPWGWAPDKVETAFAGTFQQYNLSAAAGNKWLRVGGSVSYLHDVLPQRKNTDSVFNNKIPTINRFRINAWATAQLGRKNVLSAYFNAAPQGLASEAGEQQFSVRLATSEKGRQYLLNPAVKLETKFSESFSNKLVFSYVNGRNRLNRSGNQFDSDNNNLNSKNLDSIRAEFFNISTSLLYRKTVGSWLVEPSVNITFQKAYQRTSSFSASRWNNDLGTGSYSMSIFKYRGELLMASPALLVGYKNFFQLQGGVLLDETKLVEKEYRKKKSYPFVNVAINMMPMLAKESAVEWKLFGSLSEQFSYFDNVYRLTDFNHTMPIQKGAVTTLPFLTYPNPGIVSADTMRTMWQAGTMLSVLNKRVVFNYNYSNAEQLEVQIITVNFPQSFSYLAIGKYLRRQHHISIQTNIVDKKNYKWTAGLFVNVINNKKDFRAFIPGITINDKPNTGGLTNRINFKNFSAGLDILYLFKQGVTFLSPQYHVVKHNALQLQHVYLAYSFTPERLKNLDVFISCRNLADSETYPLDKNEKSFYGAGLKVIL